MKIDLEASDDKLISRVMERIEVLSRIGEVPGVGMWRRPYTKEEAEAVERVTEWMQAAGLDVRRDAAGNLIGRAEGKAGGPAVVTGSHLDTVKNGGQYDGVLGVLGGLAAVEELLQQYGQPTRPLEVVSFVGEEGSRFPSGFIGSKAWLGELTADELAKEDAEGVTMAEAMKMNGFDPGRVSEAERDDVGAFVELHIEQGRVLQEAKSPIGIVTSIVGMHQVEVTLTGRADHAGTTPLPLRRDPMVAAAQMITTMTERVKADGSVITIGHIEAEPGGANIVPARVRFTIDFRHPDPEPRLELFQRLKLDCDELASQNDVELAWRVFNDQDPVPMDHTVVSTLKAAAEEIQAGSRTMTSGAGHDALVLGQRFPTGMLFVPSREGRSHSPDEWTAPDHIGCGVQVLSNALGKLAYERTESV